jgi:hypothetical protein
MKVEHVYNGFHFKFKGMVLTITCVLQDNTCVREYDIENVESIQTQGEYAYFQCRGGKQIQLKFEGDSGIVLDEFDNDGEFVDTIGCHDFWDDVVID